jgi:hypothetical protein
MKAPVTASLTALEDEIGVDLALQLAHLEKVSLAHRVCCVP